MQPQSPRSPRSQETSTLQKPLDLIIKSCQGLPKAKHELVSSRDPYVVVKVLEDKQIKAKTHVVKNSINPAWNQVFQISTPPKNTLQLEVWDWNRVEEDEFIGQVTVPLTKATLGQDQTLQLEPGDAKHKSKKQSPKGSITFCVVTDFWSHDVEPTFDAPNPAPQRQIHTLFREEIAPPIRNVDDEAVWLRDAIAKINRDAQRSSGTHLIKLTRINILRQHNLDFYLKDESTHPTGSLKHRLAKSLFLYGLCCGWITSKTTVVEASSGSTAVSEAYFASMLGLKFIAVMPKSTSQSKIDIIKFYGGDVHFVEKASDVYAASHQLAAQTKGHFMNQFKYASVATDFHGEGNIAASIFQQMEAEPFPIPAWICCGAGTGGTSATLSRYSRLKCHSTKICVADPENSVFYHYWKTGNKDLRSTVGSKIEGIGRPRVEKSFIRESVSDMIYVKDNYSVAAMRVLEAIIGKKVGPSTGTNFYAMLLLASDMIKAKQEGSLVGILCDPAHGFDITQAKKEIESFLAQGTPLQRWEAPDLS